ncbi:proline oxidase PrnD [Pyronema omphalodes]|nr:proline oxidase PrnD [Pyronema omphalodes]
MASSLRFNLATRSIAPRSSVFLTTKQARTIAYVPPRRASTTPKLQATIVANGSHGTANGHQHQHQHHNNENSSSSSSSSSPQQQQTPTSTPKPGPLARIPTSHLVRSLLLHTITSNPTLLKVGSTIMTKTADRIDFIPPLKWVVDKTFYAQFCAGATPTSISTTISSLRSLGYTGIILAYAREVDSTTSSSNVTTTSSASSEIQQWLTGTLRTISLCTPQDFLAIKFTGAGRSVIPVLRDQRPCTDLPGMDLAIETICSAAKEKGVGLLVDAEQAALQPGVDRWALEMMRRYNKPVANDTTSNGSGVTVYNTYQMYLKRSSNNLLQHIKTAQQGNWNLGVKLVRGAYLHSDPRDLIHANKRDTDEAYNTALEKLIRSNIATVVATHNRESVEIARRIKAPGDSGRLVFAQLMGMADELSQELVLQGERVVKYAVWGETGECVKYLLRRAEENLDAVKRSRENWLATMEELKERFKGI